MILLIIDTNNILLFFWQQMRNEYIIKLSQSRFNIEHMYTFI